MPFDVKPRDFAWHRVSVPNPYFLLGYLGARDPEHQMPLSESYVVRMYQRRSKFSGVVEIPRTGQRKPFRSMFELWAIVTDGEAGAAVMGATVPSTRRRR
ncbi:MAG TPA: hypothetical protein VFB20_07425 [Burkholderiales bacterium]|nr:hypothetical protein [Burkholderiales bacterium]